MLLGKSLREIENLDAEEILIWANYLQNNDPDPWAERRMAMTCWTTAASHGSRAKLTDFLPKRKVKVSEPAMKAMLLGWSRSLAPAPSAVEPLPPARP